MSDWQRMIVAFDDGIDVSSGNMVFTQKVGLVDALNVDFGDRGALRARRGTTRVLGSGFTRRDLDASNLPDDNVAAFATLAASGYAKPVVHTLRDRLGERAAVATRGRLFSYDGQRWQDRLGFLSARYRRLAEFSSVVGQAGVAPSWATPWAPAVAATFGPADQDLRARLLNDNADPASFDIVTSPWGPGNAARNGTTHMAVFGQVNTNNLIAVIRSGTAGTVTQVTLATDWKGGTGATWAATTLSRTMIPAICSDFDETHFLVAYWTNVVNQYKLLRVSTAGAVVASQTGTYGTGADKSIWITNTAVATNRAVVCLTDSVSTGAQTRVVASSTLVDQALNVDVDAGSAYSLLGHLVAGVAESGQCWLAMVNDAGTLRVVKRSTSAATSTLMFTRPGSSYSVVGIHAAPAVNSMVNWGVRHQPVKVAGRILLGLATTPSLTGSRTADTGAAATSFRDACTWYSVDLTDVHQTGGAAGTGSLRDPVMVARSAEDQVFPYWPSAAVVDSAGTSYRFPSSRWSTTFLSTSSQVFLLQGEEARVGLNEVAITSLRSAHHREATVFDGAVPRVLTRDAATPVGFPCGDRPSITIATSAGGSLAAGSYSAQAVWTCVDASGQVHRSGVSGIVTLGGVALNNKLTLSATQPHLNERDHLTVYTEFYVTSVNPTGNAVHYFVGRAAYDPTAVLATVNVTSVPSTQAGLLYTDGGVLQATFVQGGGGLCVAGQRAWISDGVSCFGSRLANYLDEAPSWSNNNVLTVEIPGGAGRVLSLVALDDKVIALCERGIWGFAGDGPDDLGQGQAFSVPVKISDLGVAGPRSAVYTPRGVVLQAANTSNDWQDSGGLWLLDRSLTVTQVSPRVRDYLTTAVLDVSWHPERELVLFASPNQFDNHLMWDTRADKWSRWTISPSAPQMSFDAFASVNGVVWTSGTEVYSMDRATGKDEDSTGTLFDFTSQVVTDPIPIAGDQLAWGRCRSVTPLGDATIPLSFSLTMTVKLDEVGTSMTANLGAVPTTAGTNAWPANRLAPECFLSQQKCSVLQVTLNAFAGPMNISGLELKVRSLGEGRRGQDRHALL